MKELPYRSKDRFFVFGAPAIEDAEILGVYWKRIDFIEFSSRIISHSYYICRSLESRAW